MFEAQNLMDLEWNDFSKEAIIGNLSSVKGTEHDPYYLLDKAVAEDKQIPKLLIMCVNKTFISRQLRFYRSFITQNVLSI